MNDKASFYLEEKDNLSFSKFVWKGDGLLTLEFEWKGDAL